MDEPEQRGTLPSGINPWVRQPYDPDAPDPIKVAGGRKSQITTRERYGNIIKVCENPKCNKSFEVARWRESMTFACSTLCRDTAYDLRVAGKLPRRPLSPNVAHEPWKLTESWKKAHPEEST